ncbi:carbamate kinase [Fodinicola acaciae]|uniref:carbamate kinase n=1 Tax=Fodinicola acaciae TaxID=2681555 RepID=UPI0013D82231|nr:carbamate kinase [Fodinicola acaciae]
MRIVVALGGNALLRRGEHPDFRVQSGHVARAAAALAALSGHQLVVTHGNGPQVGLLAAESEQDGALSRPYPFDVLGAETQGMIGYLLVQGLENAGLSAACLLCRTVVRPDDPAFLRPTKFVGPVYDEKTARRLAVERGWTVRPDGDAWRRVVASPDPIGILELPLIRTIAATGTVLVCAGGGGIPVRQDGDQLDGVEAVVDKDLTASLLAVAVDADALLLLTDVDAVYTDYGTPAARPLHRTTVRDLRSRSFAEGSMGPKVEAACRFAEKTGRVAVIGRLEDAAAALDGSAGTTVTGT